MDTDLNTISEVGSPTIRASSESDMWWSIIELQNRNITQLLEQLKQSKENIEVKSVTLPIFHPESVNINVNSWCSTVDLIMAEYKLEGSSLVIALSKCMQGSASQWLSQISFPGMTWDNFKELLLQRYGAVETTAATISNILNSQPEEKESLPVYGSRLITTLMNRLKNASMEEVAVSIVLAHTARFNSGLQRLVFTKDIKTRSELQQEMKAYEYVKNKSLSSEEQNDRKRIKLSGVECHFCGKLGHKMIDCRAKNMSLLKSKAEIKTKTSLTCYKCGIVGHIASHCTNQGIKLPLNQKTITEKRVNLCDVLGSRSV